MKNAKKKMEWNPEEEENTHEEEEVDESPSDETLEADVSEPEITEEPTAEEEEKEVGIDELAEPIPSWGEPNAMDLEKPESAELEPEVPLERLEEQEVIRRVLFRSGSHR
jgi:hypothetical protein